MVNEMIIEKLEELARLIKEEHGITEKAKRIFDDIEGCDGVDCRRDCPIGQPTCLKLMGFEEDEENHSAIELRAW